MKDKKAQENNQEQENNDKTPNPVDMSFMIDVPEPPKLSEDEARFYGQDPYAEEEDAVFSTIGDSVPETLRRIEGNKILNKHREEEEEGGTVEDNSDNTNEESTERPTSKKDGTLDEVEGTHKGGADKDKEGSEDPKEEKKASRKSAKEVFSDEDFKPSFEGFDSKEETKPKEDPFEKEKDFIESLSTVEKQSFEIWKHAESVDPKYKGRAQKQLDYIKAHREESEKFLQEDPDTALEDNPDYVDWVNKNRPKVNPDEFNALGQDYLVNRASIEAEKRVEEKYKPIKDKVKEFENRPKLEESFNKYTNHLVDFLPEDINNAYKEAGNDPEKLEEVAQKFPVEVSVVGEEFRKTQELGKSLMELRLGFKKFNESDPAQKALADSIVNYGKQMLEHPEGDKVLVQDGKRFVPREKFNTLPAEERSKHWTFSDQDVLELLATDMEIRISKGIESRKKQQEELVRSTLKSRGLPVEEIEKILQGSNANEKPVKEDPKSKGPRGTSPHRKPPSRTPGNSVAGKGGRGSSLLDAFLDPVLED